MWNGTNERKEGANEINRIMCLLAWDFNGDDDSRFGTDYVRG